ncbi:MAG: zinc ribbon domain-containing protein [Endomicrobiales bacterium]
MIDVKENIKLLISLQEKDLVLDKLRHQAEAIPKEIEAQKGLVSEHRSSAEEKKKSLIQMQLKRKDKEGELAAKEGEIRKHSTELNSVKSNEAYRALLVEIESAKQDKSNLENEILGLMEKIEAESAFLKEEEKKQKQQEGEIQAEVSRREAELGALITEIARLEAERSEFVRQVSDAVLHHYDSIRERRQGIAVAVIEGENCSGCHFELRPQLINEVCKGQELIVCDSCSRILYRK